MKRFASRYWFPLLMSLIAAVSAIDTLLIIKFEDTINYLEENPIGVCLLNLNAGEIWVFVRAKIAGTIIVLSVLQFLRHRRSNKALPVTGGVAAYQTGLLTYLLFA